MSVDSPQPFGRNIAFRGAVASRFGLDQVGDNGRPVVLDPVVFQRIASARTVALTKLELNTGGLDADDMPGDVRPAETWATSSQGSALIHHVRVRTQNDSDVDGVATVRWRVFAAGLQQIVEPEQGLAEHGSLTGAVTVVDASEMLRSVATVDLATTRGLHAGEGRVRAVAASALPPIAAGTADWNGKHFEIDLTEALARAHHAQLVFSAELISPDGTSFLPAASQAKYDYTRSTASSEPVIVLPAQPSPPPTVESSRQWLGYAPYRWVQPDRWQIARDFHNPTFEAVLDHLGISSAVGTKFTLDLDTVPDIVSQLSLGKQIELELEQVWSWVAGAFDWVATKFQDVCSDIATSVFGKESKLGSAAVEGLLGALPGSPLTGNFLTLIEKGEGYVQGIVGSKADDSSASAEEKDQAKNLVSEFFAALRAAAAHIDDPDQFLIVDPDSLERTAIAFIRISYFDLSSTLPADATGGATIIEPVVHYDGGPTPHAPQGFGGLDLYSGKADIPAGHAGESYVVPVFFTEPNFQSFEWTERLVADNAQFKMGYLTVMQASARAPWGIEQ